MNGVAALYFFIQYNEDIRYLQNTVTTRVFEFWISIPVELNSKGMTTAPCCFVELLRYLNDVGPYSLISLYDVFKNWRF